jgi:archaellum component FlaC
MNDQEPANMIVTQLRAIRGDISDVKNRLSNIESNLGTIMQHQGNAASQSAQIQVAIDRQSLRIERIESRLGLVDA